MAVVGVGALTAGCATTEHPAAVSTRSGRAPLPQAPTPPGIRQGSAGAREFADTIIERLGGHLEVISDAEVGGGSRTAVLADGHGGQLRVSMVTLPDGYEMPLNPTGLRHEVPDVPEGLQAFELSTGMSRQFLVGQRSTNTMVQFTMSPNLRFDDAVLVRASAAALALSTPAPARTREP